MAITGHTDLGLFRAVGAPSSYEGALELLCVARQQHAKSWQLRAAMNMTSWPTSSTMNESASQLSHYCQNQISRAPRARNSHAPAARMALIMRYPRRSRPNAANANVRKLKKTAARTIGSFMTMNQLGKLDQAVKGILLRRQVLPKDEAQRTAAQDPLKTAAR
jgi:hypothetical protein